MSEASWKITAVIFIILAIAEFVFICYVIGLGIQSLEYEKECAITVCKGYDYYGYDDSLEICNCYEGDKLKVQKNMGS